MIYANLSRIFLLLRRKRMSYLILQPFIAHPVMKIKNILKQIYVVQKTLLPLRKNTELRRLFLHQVLPLMAQRKN